MKIDFNDYVVTDIMNPSTHCTQIGFENPNDPDIQKRFLVIFDNQIKYIEIEEHKQFKRVRFFVRGDEESIDIDFAKDNYSRLDLLMKSVYNS